MQLDTIVISTDLSPASLEALTPAFGIAPKGSAKLIVVTVVEAFIAAPHGAPLAPPAPPIDTQARMDEARGALAGWCAEQGVEAELEVLSSNDVAGAIDEFALERGADLLVLATHGRRGFRHMVLGSIAEAILRGAQCPVLVFPQPKKAKK